MSGANEQRAVDLGQPGSRSTSCCSVSLRRRMASMKRPKATTASPFGVRATLVRMLTIGRPDGMTSAGWTVACMVGISRGGGRLRA